MGLALVVHGGAGAIGAERFDAARAGCRAAALAGWAILRSGGAALDAVQAAIAALEDDPSFNAGTGAVLNADGRAQLDAGLMDGHSLALGAVAAVERVKNPVALAREVLRSPHVLLVGEGAERFATARGIALCAPADLITPARRARWRAGTGDRDDVIGPAAPAPASGDGRVGPAPSRRRSPPGPAPVRDDDRHGTVGAVAVDGEGRTAAGASTGGIAGKHPGRVGDTPLAGSGFYAEDGVAGVSCTGHGEDFVRLLLARRAAELVGAGLSAQAAASAAIALLGERLHGEGGLILLDAYGRVGCARNTSAMAYAYVVDGMVAPAAAV